MHFYYLHKSISFCSSYNFLKKCYTHISYNQGQRI